MSLTRFLTFAAVALCALTSAHLARGQAPKEQKPPVPEVTLLPKPPPVNSGNPPELERQLRALRGQLARAKELEQTGGIFKGMKGPKVAPRPIPDKAAREAGVKALEWLAENTERGRIVERQPLRPQHGHHRLRPPRLPLPRAPARQRQVRQHDAQGRSVPGGVRPR